MGESFDGNSKETVHGKAWLGGERFGRAGCGKATNEVIIMAKKIETIEDQIKKPEWRTVNLRITGDSPLLMHSPAGLDPFHPISREKKRLTDKKTGKTDEDKLELLRLDFIQSFYWDGEKVFFPAENIKACIAESAGVFNKGKGAKVRRSVRTGMTKVPLRYTGPKTPDELWTAPGFRYIRNVGTQGGGGSVMRCRPVFETWGCDVTFLVSTKELTVDDFMKFAVDAGEYIGIGDFRPNCGGEFGRFKVESV